MGGSGDYFDVADRVIALDNYLPQDVTTKAQKIAQAYSTERIPEGGTQFGAITPRKIAAASINPSRGKREVNIKTRGLEHINFGELDIDLTAVEQIIDPGQLKAIALAIIHAKKYIEQKLTLTKVLELVAQDMIISGLDIISNSPQGDLVQFRTLELAAAINRLRSLKVLD